MKITHVVRGEDLLSSTPRQIAVYRAMGVPEEQFPVFAHLPYVLGKDGQRLSKRNGVVSVNWYRQEGFLPEAIDNYLALLGWSPGDNREEFTLEEMAAELESINGDKIRALDPADFVSRIIPFLQRAHVIGDPPTDAEVALVTAAAPLIQTRISRLTEAVGMLVFLFAGAGFEVDPQDAAKVLTPDAAPVLRAAEAALAEVEPWTAEAIEAALFAALVEPAGLGLKPRVAFAPVRVAVTGHRVSPPLYESIQLLGRERTLARLAEAAKAAG
jgi:glutamyl-tRNA synthetase